MEIGTVSAILEISGAAAKASLVLYELILTIKNAPREILLLKNDIKSLSTLLSRLQSSLDSPGTQRIVTQDNQLRQAVDGLSDLITSCERTCLRITAKLGQYGQSRWSQDASTGNDSDTSSPEPQVPRSAISTGSSLLWYFRRKDILALTSELQRTKSIFSDSMNSITLLVTLRLSAAQLQSDSVGSVISTKGHRFDDDAGSAITRWAVEVESERLSTADTLSVSTGMLSQPATSKTFDPQLTEEFLGAVKRGKIGLVGLLLKHVDVNTQGPRDGRVALSIAAELGNVSMAKVLLDHGALVSIRQYSRSCPDGLGANWNAGRTPLNWAASKKHSDMVKLLLDYGANPDSANSAGRTALHTACMRDDRRSVRLLLERGADVNLASFHHGWAPVHEAAHNNNDGLLQILLEFRPLLDVNMEFHGERKAPLHIAVIRRNLAFMKLLLSNGADPDIGMIENNTALHLAAAGGWVDGINLLLDSNASINCKDSFLFETPLHKAARNQQVEACQILCARGANTAMRNIDGHDYQTVLDFARKYPKDWSVPNDRVFFLT